MKEKVIPYPENKFYDHSQFYSGEHHLVAFLSDTHLGSKLCRYHAIDTAYKIIDQEGVKTVYHCGDVVDGIGMYRGHHFELLKHSYQDQKWDVVDNYPKVEGVTTYMISGNHDASFLRAIGADILEAVAKERKDLIYLGQVEAEIEIAQGVRLRLWHPGGAPNYAKSYRLQRAIDSMEGGTKPNILAVGHYHYDFYMSHRNIHALQVPCFQGQSLYLKEKGLMPTVGFWLVELHIKDGSINRFKPELIKFF